MGNYKNLIFNDFYTDAWIELKNSKLPILIYGKGILPKNLGTLSTFSDISATISHIFGLNYQSKGQSFRDKIISHYAITRLDCEV